MIGAAGLLSILGVGGLVAHWVNDDRDTAPAVQPGVAEPGVPERPKTVEERVAAIKSTAAKAGPGVLRPLPSASVAGDVTVTTAARDGGTLKVVSARQDLTGYRELGWVADPGERVGRARCSDRIRLSVDAKATAHPTLLICWRTSTQKSVYTLAVKTDGRPSAKTSVAAIDKQWTRLG